VRALDRYDAELTETGTDVQMRNDRDGDYLDREQVLEALREWNR
jgi:hypothetical protein